MALVLNHQTKAEFLARLRTEYLVSTGMKTCKIARWIIDALNAGNITVAECRTAWGASPPQWSAINGRMDTQAASYSTVTTAVGE